MSRHDNPQKREEELMRGVYEWLEDAEDAHGVDIAIEMHASALRLRYRVELVARRPASDGTYRQYAKVGQLWPNERNTQFCDVVFQLTLRLTRILDEQAAGVASDTAKHTYSGQSLT